MAEQPTDVRKLESIGKEEEIYTSRFTATQDAARVHTWRTLCSEFFSRYVGRDDVLVDLGAGDGLFVRNIQAKRKIAVDISAHALKLRDEGIEVLQVSATDFADKLDEPADIVFMSNFLEHMPTKQLVLDVLEESRRALKPNGRVLILQPNIRYVGPAYWDYIDHHIALTEHSLVEALEISGFVVEELIPRFLPYTAKSRLGNFSGLVSLYLKLPFLWRIFGAQTFVIGRKVER